MLKVIVTEKDFKERFEEWKAYRLDVDPYLKCAVDFLGKKLEEISEEAVLASILRDQSVELRKE